MQVNVCGIKYKVIEREDSFTDNTHFGCVEYSSATITINKNLEEQMKTETIIHEMVHAMLMHIGEEDLKNNEKFVQTLANAIYQGFEIKKESTFSELPLPNDSDVKVTYDDFVGGLKCKD